MADTRLTPLNVGVVPSDWKIVSLKSLATSIRNGFVGVSLPHQTNQGGVRYLQGFNIRPNKIELINETFVTVEFADKQVKARLRANDLLTVQSGHIGTTALVPAELEGASCHALIITTLKPKLADPRFIVTYMNSHIGQARMRGLHVGSSIPHINTSELADYRVPLPPQSEQNRIADILCTWNEALEKLNALITAKERYYMAILESALKRYADTDCKVHDVTHETGPRNRAKMIARVLSVTNSQGFVLPENYFDKQVASSDTTGYKIVRRGEYAYNPSRINVGSIARLETWDEGVVSPIYVVFGLNERIEADYFHHWLNSHEARSRIRRSAQGSVRDSVNFADFGSIRLPLPKREQQKAIVDCLNTAQSEIRLLQKQHDALGQQQRGLMQQLLTGTIRVKIA